MGNNRTFFQYVIPSVLAFALSGVYTIVDGFFIGNSLGDVGLAAINIAFPISAFMQALGTGIGMAGAIRFTILSAQGRGEEEREVFSGTILLLLLTSVFLTGLFLACSTPVLSLLGAAGELLPLARQYVAVIALGSVFQVLATGLIPFIRNMGGAAFAMVAMAAGFLTNIALDYAFVWVRDWGMTGAAAATVIGQGVTLLATALYLWIKKVPFALPPAKTWPHIFQGVLKLSFSPFGLTFSPNITLILMNRFLLLHGDEKAVAAYACVAYITAIVYLLLQGVGDGSQPLISRFYGEQAGGEMKKTRSLAYRAGAVIALSCTAGLLLARGGIGALFGSSPEVSQAVAAVLPLFLASLLFLSFVRITTAFFYATEQGSLSYLLVYAEPVLLLALLLILPQMAGVRGVWTAVPLAQVLTWTIAWFAKRRVDRRLLVSCP